MRPLLHLSHCFLQLLTPRHVSPLNKYRKSGVSNRPNIPHSFSSQFSCINKELLTWKYLSNVPLQSYTQTSITHKYFGYYCIL